MLAAQGGAVAGAVIEQVTRTVPFSDWRNVFVGPSGSFRFDQAVKAVHPDVAVHSSDVSLRTCALGTLATGAEFALTFTGRLAFIEDHVRGQPFAARVAAVEVAQEMARYAADNAFAVAHFAHYQERFPEFLAPVSVRLVKFLGKLSIVSFNAGDFRQQATRAAEAGGGIVAFPATTKGTYERLSKFLDANTEWDRPQYDTWDPATLDGWLDELDALGVRYCVVTERALARHEPVAVYRNSSNWPVFTFSDRAGSSVRWTPHKSEPFAYTPLDPATLGKVAHAEIVRASSGQMTFMKDHYLAKGIVHASGTFNFLVYLNGCLAGGFIYRADKFKAGMSAICFAISPCHRKRASRNLSP